MSPASSRALAYGRREERRFVAELAQLVSITSISAEAARAVDVPCPLRHDPE